MSSCCVYLVWDLSQKDDHRQGAAWYLRAIIEVRLFRPNVLRRMAWTKLVRDNIEPINTTPPPDMTLKIHDQYQQHSVGSQVDDQRGNLRTAE